TWFSMHIAYRTRPIYAPVSAEQQNLDRYRAALEPVRRLVFVGVPIALGLFSGSAAASQWQTALLWLNRQPFGTNDPAFEMYVWFYVFTLPWLSLLVSFAALVLGLVLIGALLTLYVYGVLQLKAPWERTTGASRIHLAVLLSFLIAVRGLSFWRERYALLT